MDTKGKTDSELVLGPECYAVMGACFEVYRLKGCGFLEAVYQECLEMELALRGLAYEAQKPFALEYKGRVLGHSYRADLVVGGAILVELKAIDRLVDEHRACVLNYLHAARLRVGLLVNFGHHPRLEWERFVV